MSQHKTTVELPPLDDPAEVLSFLRAGDTVAHCHVTGWRLVKANVRVSSDAIGVLKGGGYMLEPFGGILAPLGDGLLPSPLMSQTWAWAEARSHGRH